MTTSTTTPKKPAQRLPKPLKANFDRWLNYDYYGQKLTYDRFNKKTGGHEQVTGPLPINQKGSLNFWLAKDGLSGRDKRDTVIDLFRLYAKREISYESLIWFCKPPMNHVAIGIAVLAGHAAFRAFSTGDPPAP
jgi:hypothetical protein